MSHSSACFRLNVVVLLAGLLLASVSGMALVQKDPRSPLDAKVFILPEIRLPAPVSDLDTLQGFAQAAELERFRLQHGNAWMIWLDQRRNATALLTGGAIPFIPGNANTLQWAAFEAGCGNASCLSEQTIEALTREFLVQNQRLLGVNPSELVLIRENLGPVEHMYFVSYRQEVDGIPVEGAIVNFRINGGNLIQVATDRIAPVRIGTVPSISPRIAWETLMRHIDDFPAPEDYITDVGSLRLIPITPRGGDPDGFAGAPGTGIEHALVYRLQFERKGVVGRWEALVDAHSGELLRFVDTNRYGKAHGVVYPGDGHNNQVDRVFSFAHTNLSAPNDYTNEGGLFPGDNATIDFALGKYTRINDSCGTTALTTTNGDADYGESTGTDCTVPSPNPGGAGNTWSAKVQFYHLTAINIKARSYHPANTWLTTQWMNVNVNQAAWCNATSGSGTLNFYQAQAPCWNLGELPGVSLHEWGHSWDDFDGSGSDSPPLETRADWTATIMIRDSCTGRGAGFSCGYGDACTNCDGVRDSDYWYTVSQTPYTGANHTMWGPCTGGSYFGPCGGEDHCESLLSTQALWDMTRGDRTAPEPDGDFFTQCGLDGPSGWQLNDRLWWTSHPQLANMYTCSSWNTSGCGANTLYTLFMAIDDDGDGVANGTPHAAGIFSALNRHLIACGAAGDAANQNHTSPACPTLAQVTGVGVATGSNQLTVSWGAVANADRYDVYRNESGCGAGYTRIAQVNAPTTQVLDTTVVNGITYYYRVQAFATETGCSGTYGAISDCVTGTPQPCAGAVNLARVLYACTDQVDVTVLDSTVTLPVTVKFWSSVDGTQKTLTLTNNPAGSATYTGHFHTVPSGAGADQVNVANGATITVRFTDPDYCGTPNQNVDATGTIDCVGPVISNVLVTNITDSSATVTWTTNESANSRVTYGTAVPPGINNDDLTTYVTNHSVNLAGLTGCTDYFFSVTSADAASNSSTNNNGGTYYTFRTYGRVFVMGPDDVEGGAGSWTASGQWHIDTCKASSPTHAWKAGSTTCPGTQAISTTSDLTWGADISLGAAGHGAKLRWMEWYDTEGGYDWCRPQISTNGGGTWTTLGTQYAGSGTTWTQKELDLAAYTGNVRIRFEAYADSLYSYEGWYVDDINVSRSAPCGPELHRQSHALADDCAAGGTGDGDGVLDAGETAVIQVTAVNTGTQPATGVTATISTVSAGVTVTDNSAAFPDIAQNGGTGTSIADHFAIAVDPTVACGTVLDFTLTFTAALGTWNDAFSVTVGVPISASGTAFADDFENAATWSNWTVTTGPGPHTCGPFARVNQATGRPVNSTGYFALSNSDACGGGSTTSTILTSPVIDASNPAWTAVSLEYDLYYNHYDGDDATVQVYNGSSWVTVWTDPNADLNAHQTVDVSAQALGNANFRVRFSYQNAAYDYWYAVDNVQVKYTAPPGCTMTACAASGPIVQYDGSYNPNGSLVQACGDGDGVVEPGEDWRVTVRLKNAGTSQATATVADLAVNGGSAVAATILTGNPGSFGTIAAGGTATDTYEFRVDAGAPCGNSITFDVINISSTEQSYPSQTAMFAVPVGIVSGGGNETATQVTTPLDATNSTADSTLAPAFTLAAANTATLSYNSNFTPQTGTFTLFSDEFAADPATNGWTETGNVISAVATPTDTCGGGGGNYAFIPGAGTTPGNSIRRGVDTTGRSNIQLVMDYRYVGMESGEGIFVDYSTTGVNGAYTNIWSQTSTGNNQTTAWGDDCARIITFPASCENNANFAFRIRNNADKAAETVWVDHLSVTGDGSSGGSWTANAQVSLVNPAAGVTVLKAYGTADGSPYNVQPYYTGPGTYQIRLEENAGGMATVTGGSMQVVMNPTTHCAVSSCGSTAPPPVKDTGADAAKFTKGTGNTLNVTYDAVSCAADKVVILYGTIGTWTGYAGCAQNNGGNTGTTTINSSGQTSTWYNLVWTSGTTAGHPGFATGGPRTWNANGQCGMTADDQTHASCP